MAENETVLVNEVPENQAIETVEPVSPAPQEPSKGQKFKSGVKEWFRKRTVGLKRKPQNIALLLLAVSTIYFMLILFKLSDAVFKGESNQYVKATGICIFVVTLLSLLVLVSFLNAFPKRKKPNIFFIVLVFVMIGAMLACDIVSYIQMTNCLQNLSSNTSLLYIAVDTALPYIIGHIVLLGLSAVVFALLPVYSKLINKINTKVELESATENMSGAIDIQED
ncbi:MAG: hypothetical protein K2O89_06725 [Clostridia bacterium]|nr:hypothetical protein [Clostridia bacterium]